MAFFIEKMSVFTINIIISADFMSVSAENTNNLHKICANYSFFTLILSFYGFVFEPFDKFRDSVLDLCCRIVV